MTCQIQTGSNRVYVAGSLALADLRRLTATLHNLTSKQGYEEIRLDFERCTSAQPSAMVALSAQVTKLRDDGVNITLTLPNDEQCARRLRGANWAYHLDPKNYKPSTYRGYTQVPAARYCSEQTSKKS